MPLCYLGVATDGKFFRLDPALPFSRSLQSKIVFPVSHPNLAFLYQLVLFPIMHEILATERLNLEKELLQPNYPYL